MNKKYILLITTILLSIFTFSTPNGVAPTESGYVNDSEVVNFLSKDSVEESDLILKGATKNYYLYSTPTARNDVDPSNYANVEKTIGDTYIEWKVTFNKAFVKVDKPKLSIFLSKNLKIQNGSMKIKWYDKNNQTSNWIIDGPHKQNVTFQQYLNDWRKSLAHYLPNGLNDSQISEHDKNKSNDQKYGNGLFVMNYKSGSKTNLNKFGKQVGDIYLIYDKTLETYTSGQYVEVTFRTNKIDSTSLTNTTNEVDYFVAAVFKSRAANLYDYVFGTMNVHTIKKRENNEKYLFVKNTFYGMDDNDHSTVNMNVNLNSNNYSYTFRYDNVSKTNNKFSKNFVISSSFFQKSNISFTPTGNYVTSVGEVQTLSNGYSVNVDYYNLGEYEYLNNAQKKAFVDKLRALANGNDKDKVYNFNTLRDEALKAEKAMKALQEEVNKSGVKNTGKYTGSRENLRNDYDTKLEEAKRLLNKESGENKDLSSITKLTTNLTNARESLNGTDELSNDRHTAKTKIEGLKNLNNAQKEALKVEIDNASDESSINLIITKATELSNSMTNLKEKISEIEDILNSYEYINDETGHRNEFDENIREAKRILESNGENKDKAYVDALIEKIKDSYAKIKNNSLAKYEDIVNKFYDVDTSIVNNFDRIVYTNFDIGMSIYNLSKKLAEKNKLELKDFPTDVQFGFNLPVTKNIKLGSFVEYKNKDEAHILGVGVNGKLSIDNNNLLSFVRYKLIYFDKLINHNVETYLQYYYDVKVGKFTFSPKIGTLLVYSKGMDIDKEEGVVLKDRISSIFDISNRLSYSLDQINGLIYLDTTVNAGINTNQKIYKTDNENNVKVIYHGLFDILGVLGYEQRIKDFAINTNFSVDDKLNVKFKIGGSYDKKW